MTFLVENCFHWIGFHVVNLLLEDGYEVIGADVINTSKKEHLEMFVGRNDGFTHITEKSDHILYDAVIRIGDNELEIHKGQTSTIKLPLLFGEWMPMNVDGFYSGDTFISFESNYFLTEGVYIEDFLKILMQCIQSSQLPSVLKVRSANKGKDTEVKLENSIYIRDNVPIQNNAKVVVNHFKKFKAIYECN